MVHAPAAVTTIPAVFHTPIPCPASVAIPTVSFQQPTPTPATPALVAVVPIRSSAMIVALPCLDYHTLNVGVDPLTDTKRADMSLIAMAPDPAPMKRP